MYNTTMFKLKCLVMTVFLGVNSLTAFSADKATTLSPDEAIAAQKTACTKNTAMEWSASLNRCVGKAAARETRNQASACDDVKEVSAREKCHIQLA
ncbi:MAG: hypothetical protein K2Q18_14385, partial [Bdellovibrionales bacterium]|nr:hypothetical protein [Bdellovibrionales bacterium]